MTKSIDGRRSQRRITAWSSWLVEERGSATVVVALTATALVAMLALGIDLGALFTARSEAQRAADAAALAGASAFLEYQQENARSVAIERAVQFATINTIRGATIEPGEVTVSVDLNESTVTARVRRNGVSTWFARLFGVDSVAIGAEATAWAGAAGAAQCVKPFAVPDLWEETTQDVNRNRIWDEGETWRFDPASGDRYTRYGGSNGSGIETGYGSTWRDGQADADGRRYDADYGRRITVKVTDPRQTLMPSFFLPWVLPQDPNQAACGAAPPGGGGGGGSDGGDGGDGGADPSGPPDSGHGRGWTRWQEKRGDLGSPPSSPGGGNDDGNNGGSNGGGSNGGGSNGGGSNGGGSDGGGRDDGSGRGAARYRQNICSCNASVIDLDTEYVIEPGNMVGPTYQGVRVLIDQDPDAYWDDRTNTLVSEYGMDSPRVITVALFDPAEISSPGRQYIRFNNFARIFLEEQASRQDAVTGRLLYYVPGIGTTGGSGKTTGSLVRTLQLIR